MSTGILPTVTPINPHTHAPSWPRVARLVLISRTIDLIEERELAPAGKVAYQFSARGHELAQVLLGLTLTHPHDAAAVYYRSRPFVLAAGMTIQEAFAAGMAKTGSPSEGRDTGVGYFLPPRNGVTVLPMSGNVGAQYSPAAGWAQAITYRREVLQQADWNGAIAAALGGDGSVVANGFWAALNIATTLRLPMLFFVEDNAYAISVPSALQYPGANIAGNLASFRNLRVLQGDGTDPADSAQKIADAVGCVRAGDGPCLLRLSVVRLAGHSITDNQAYKTPEQRIAEDARDPVLRLRAFLADLDWAALEKEVEEEVRAGLAAAMQNPDPDPATAARHVLFEGQPQLVGGLLSEGIRFDGRPEEGSPTAAEAGASATSPNLPGIAHAARPVLRARSERSEVAPALPQNSPSRTRVEVTMAGPPGPRINFIDAVRRVLETELDINPRMLVFGEDVGVKGGVHGATLDLQLKFGPERVFDTSLSEEGIIGRAVGLAYAGLTPVPEIQFRKYADPATEQLNDCGWIRWRTAGKFAAPMVVRIPVGFGKRTGDPWHSVTGEAIFTHTLGWRLAFPSNASDAVGLLRTALRGNDPTFFFEHRALLDTPPSRRPYPGDDYVLPFGVAATVRPGDELTVVSWGEMVHRCLEAAQAWPGRVEVIDLRTLAPWDREAVLESVKKTGKCLVAHEDTLTGGFAGEIIATIAEHAFQYLDAPVARVATADCPIPYNPGLTRAVVPGVEVVAARLADLLAF